MCWRRRRSNDKVAWCGGGSERIFLQQWVRLRRFSLKGLRKYPQEEHTPLRWRNRLKGSFDCIGCSFSTADHFAQDDTLLIELTKRRCGVVCLLQLLHVARAGCELGGNVGRRGCPWNILKSKELCP